MFSVLPLKMYVQYTVLIQKGTDHKNVHVDTKFSIIAITEAKKGVSQIRVVAI